MRRFDTSQSSKLALADLLYPKSGCAGLVELKKWPGQVCDRRRTKPLPLKRVSNHGASNLRKQPASSTYALVEHERLRAHLEREHSRR